MKVWLLTNTPSPYQMEFLEHLHGTPALDLTVRFLRGAHRGENVLSRQKAGFPAQVLRGAGPSRWRDEFRLHPQAVREVRRGDHDVYVLSGHYTSPTFLACAAVLRGARRPWGVWLERPWPTDYRPRWVSRASARVPGAALLRRRVLGGLVRRATGVLCIGTAARDAYLDLGAPPERLSVLPYICNVARFESPDPTAVSRIRRELGLEGCVTFLFSGLLEERKGVDVLLRAFERVAARRDSARLLILGDGSLRSRLEALAPASCRRRVHFLGFRPQDELPALFKAADVFVFPSRHDGWGVVINEALGAGLPVLATRQTGAAIDLVLEGENGHLVERDDEATLARRMNELIDQSALRTRYGARSLTLSRGLSLEAGALSMTEALRAWVETERDVERK